MNREAPVTPSQAARKKSAYAPARDFIPEPGRPQEVLPGLQWLRGPLPFELDHINLWLLEGKSGWTIVDTGFNFDVMKEAWDIVFATQFRDKPVEGLFITHFHPDHFGLGGWLAERAGVTLQMTPPEFGMAKSLTDPAQQGMLGDLYRPYYIEAGIEGQLLDDMLARRFTYQKIVSKMPGTFTPVKPGDTVRLGDRDWKIIGGYGHCPEHACLYCEKDKIFIAGDMILPDISPNISFFPDIYLSRNPVAAYIKTLEKIRAQVPDDVLVLPSHGVPFKGLHQRAGELIHHHERRLTKLREVLAAGSQTAHQAMLGLFAHRSLARPADLFFALGETLAHLVYDVEAGRVVKATTDGKALYSLVG